MNERTSKLKNGLNGIKTRRRVQKEPGETWTEWDWIGLPKDRWRWRRRTEQIYQLIECLDIHRRIGHPGRTVSLQPAIHHESISVSTVNASLLFPMRFNFSIQRLETIKIQANEYREQKKKRKVTAIFGRINIEIEFDCFHLLIHRNASEIWRGWNLLKQLKLNFWMVIELNWMVTQVNWKTAFKMPKDA